MASDGVADAVPFPRLTAPRFNDRDCLRVVLAHVADQAGLEVDRVGDTACDGCRRCKFIGLDSIPAVASCSDVVSELQLFDGHRRDDCDFSRRLRRVDAEQRADKADTAAGCAGKGNGILHLPGQLHDAGGAATD